MLLSKCENQVILLLQKLREIMIFKGIKNSELISRKIFQLKFNFTLTHIMEYYSVIVWKNEEFSLTKEIFCQINSCNSFSKTVTFTEFLPKRREREFP